MARKSRKVQNIEVVEEVSCTYSVGVYVRLSVKDNRKKTDSINLQKRRILDYIDDNDDMEVHSIYEDNGATGTNFNRSGFNRMIEDVKAKKVNCIIVKDLSRFGRDYIETGNYIDKIFPFMGVRFISIGDNFDSFDAEKCEDGYLIPLKNLINEVYAKDVSKKIEVQKAQMMKKGEFVGGNAIYGYIRSSENVRKLVIDTDVAHIVKRMFQMRLDGMSYTAIAKILNNEEIKSPSSYKLSKGISKSEKFKDIYWSTTSVKRVLVNPVYTGTLVQGKTKKSLHRNEEFRRTEANEYVTFENAHEAIISAEDFVIIQVMNESVKNSHNEKIKANEHIKTKNIFKGFIYCGHCGSKLYSNRQLKDNKEIYISYYACFKNQYKFRHRDACTEFVRVHKDDVELIVTETLKKYAKTLMSDVATLSKHFETNNHQNYCYTRNQNIRKIKTDIANRNKSKHTLVENYIAGIMSESDYLNFLRKYEEDVKVLNEKLDLMLLEEKSEKQIKTSIYWVEQFEKFLEVGELTQELAEILIEKVIVNNPKDIKVIFKFKDEYKNIQQKLEDLGI